MCVCDKKVLTIDSKILFLITNCHSRDILDNTNCIECKLKS